MEFRKIKIAELIPAAYNPRKKLKSGDKEYEKIKNSIQEFGYSAEKLYGGFSYKEAGDESGRNPEVLY